MAQCLGADSLPRPVFEDDEEAFDGEDMAVMLHFLCVTDVAGP